MGADPQTPNSEEEPPSLRNLKARLRVGRLIRIQRSFFKYAVARTGRAPEIYEGSDGAEGRIASGRERSGDGRMIRTMQIAVYSGVFDRSAALHEAA